MWKLTIEDDQTNKTVVHLVRDDYGLGRSEDNAIRLTERNISRKHAELEHEGDRWLLKDLTSYNGCYVNGHRVSGNHELAHGDLIQVGDYRLAFENETTLAETHDSMATVPATPGSASAMAGSDRFVMLAGPTPGAEFVLSAERMLIGRGEDCNVSINHPSVSRVHAELHSLGDGRYEIFDQNSANGVRINGVELPRSFVEPRDVLELGDVILKFIPAGDTYLPNADESLQIAAIGAARRQEAEEGMPGGTNGKLVKWGLGVSALVLFAILVLVVLSRMSGPADIVSIQDEATARAEKTLSSAKQLLARGDVKAASQKLAELPQESSARSGADFRAIQAAYADHLFGLAAKASDPSDKRNLYDEIARSTSIDSARRTRAARELTALSSQAVDVSELPSAGKLPTVTTNAAAPLVVDPSSLPSAAPRRLPAPVVTPPKNPVQRATNTPKTTSTGLVRDNPF